MTARVMLRWSKQITPAQVVRLIKAEKDAERALSIFDSATAEYGNGFRHDGNTFSVMISSLVSSNKFVKAEDLLHRMREEKCEVQEETLLSLCRGYGRVHRPLDAIRIFEKMKEFGCEPTQKAFITVLDILVDENLLKIALSFYKNMRKIGIPTSVASLNILIKALCKSGDTIDSALRIFHEMPNHGCLPDSYTYGTLINGLCKVDKLSEAKDLFEEMKVKKCSPSVVTYTSLIHGLCQSENVNEAIQLFEEMRNKGIEPNVFTFSSLMDGFCKTGRSSEAMELLDTMNGKHQKPNVITYSTLINGHCKEGNLGGAVEILDRMKLQGLKPDSGLYGKIISGFCNLCKFQEAANLIDEMVLEGTSPNRLTWSVHVRIHNMVVQGLCSNKDSNRAFLLYLSMRTRGISIGYRTFEFLLKSFCKNGNLQKVNQILDDMVIDGCVPEERTWNALIGTFWDHKNVQLAAELLQSAVINHFVEPGIQLENQAVS